MFVDIAKIKIKAGNGGDGAVTFHREKYVASGGPDGGDGGKGGDIIFEVDDNLATLADFRYKRKYTAPDGKRGDGGRRRGKNGENLVIKIPRGTIIREAESNAVMADMLPQKAAAEAGATPISRPRPARLPVSRKAALPVRSGRSFSS